MAVKEIGRKQNVLFNIDKVATRALTERFLVPPFSVLDTKQGYWQDRKQEWLRLGIKSEIGRGDNLLVGKGVDEFDGYREKEGTKFGKCLPESIGDAYGRKVQATSIFDPVLCEIVYRWYSLENWKVLDPFSGGSVRGITASYLKRNYTGIDLREEQVVANREQYVDLKSKITDKADPNDYKPTWITGNSLDCETIAEGEYDLVFSCPPYYDLEVYSEDPNDLSNLDSYEEFVVMYRQIINNSIKMLKENRFAIFVVGDVRDANGIYYNLVGDTIQAFKDAGCKYYNEGILVNVCGTLPVRINKQFNSGRKLGKQHQNILMFYKGDPKEIKNIFGEIVL